MKLRAIAALAVTLALAFSSPAKAENVDADFVALATISYAVLQKCSSSYEFIDGGARRAADRMGADFETYAPATMNAIFVIMDMEYDRTKLIPSVTQRVRSHLEELLAEIKKATASSAKSTAP